LGDPPPTASTPSLFPELAPNSTIDPSLYPIPQLGTIFLIIIIIIIIIIIPERYNNRTN